MRKLNIVVDTLDQQHITKVSVEGFLDAHTVPEMENIIHGLIQDRKYRIIVDFQELSYISSAGLGVFMSVIGEVKNNNGDIILMNMPPKIYKVFDLLGFTEIFTIVDDEDKAIQAFR
ncbi:anti-sigma factor antagonist [candidate division KSB3 bacterium]|uniref:Anti-sigma factor antagonist n=1 Tax=candidate division KSB3 bacterium TaxID=2044937 RepID=A0A9D5JVZ6_9BACT|nr:anti-sigma factor antagonist [candidate division KSB3 bacterium]MBD3325144.1 anti-sigma factor antagonist [candidate division KSB3 bacterium]